MKRKEDQNSVLDVQSLTSSWSMIMTTEGEQETYKLSGPNQDPFQVTTTHTRRQGVKKRKENVNIETTNVKQESQNSQDCKLNLF